MSRYRELEDAWHEAMDGLPERDQWRLSRDWSAFCDRIALVGYELGVPTADAVRWFAQAWRAMHPAQDMPLERAETAPNER